MPILNYTTEVAVNKTMVEIQSLLTRRGVTRISAFYDDEGNPAGLGFTLNTDFGTHNFELPIKTAGVLNAIKKDPKIPKSKKNIEQAGRVAWRIAKVWLEAQTALIDAELTTLDEVMLPWMIDGKGETVYSIVRNQYLAIES